MTSNGAKRLVDLLLVIATLPLWLPVLVIVAVAVRLGLGSPVLFVQPRTGLREHPFAMVKFRTMTDARDANGRLRPDSERLTSLGRFLRSTSLDELPELFNVLRGEMSLVGPRPLLTRYLERYSTHHRRRHEVRPGITGLAQVSGRNAITWEQKLDLDVEYVETRTLAMDMRILWRTLTAVLTRSGINAAGDATMPEFTGYSTRPEPGTRERPR